ncbi:kirola-like [Carya illinoinensis]|uniref:kirola-like n=1 Tax=Carya illinoinensis TaxID=32201 RepID=UPI001C722CFE|nr:kirola-like [Carya illinoinensis]
MSSSLSGKLSIEIEAKSSARSMYEANAKRLYDVPKLCPTYIPKVDLVEGKWEDVGAVVNFHLAHVVRGNLDFRKGKWNIFHLFGCLGSEVILEIDSLIKGKTLISKEIYEHKDDEKLSVTFKVIGGLLMEAFKSFKFIIQATRKDTGCLVRWTLEYEKLKEDVPDPKEMLQFAVDLTKEMDANLIGHQDLYTFKKKKKKKKKSLIL